MKILEPQPNGKERVEVQDAREPAYATKPANRQEKADMPQVRRGARFVKFLCKQMRCGVHAVDTGYGQNPGTANTKTN